MRSRHRLQTFDGIVPDDVAGIAFLSGGGQSPATATVNLAALQQVAAPWPMTFSFGRALVDPALAAWRGEPGRVGAGQRALTNRVACNVGRASRRLPARRRGPIRAGIGGHRAGAWQAHTDLTGTVPVTVVPSPGRDVTTRRPPTNSARSAMLRRPYEASPSYSAPTSKPFPSSVTRSRAPEAPHRSSTSAWVARACLTTFCNASWAMRYRAISTCSGSRHSVHATFTCAWAIDRARLASPSAR